jgi:hypothetical protein
MVSQGRQVSREGEGSVRVVECPSRRPPACVPALKVIREYYHKSLPPLVEILIRTVLCRLRTIRDLATLRRVLLAHRLEYFTNKSAIQPLDMP